MSRHSFVEHDTALLSMQSLSTRDYTVTTLREVEVLDTYPDGTLKVRINYADALSVGSARKDPADKNDQTIGTKLATGRALHAMAHRLLRASSGLIKHADDVKEMKLKQASTSMKAKLAKPLTEEVVKVKNVRTAAKAQQR